MIFEIKRLHERHGKYTFSSAPSDTVIDPKYKGPIIRIGVSELHVNDADYFLDISKMGSKFTKEPAFYSGMSFPHASLGMINPSEHKTRRRVLAPAFSPDGVAAHTPWIEGRLERLCERFGQAADQGTPVNLNKALKSFTTDVVSKVVLGKEFGLLESKDFDDPRLRILHDTIRKSWIYRAFPLTFACLMSLPEAVSAALFEIPILQVAKECRDKITGYIGEQRSSASGKEKPGQDEEVSMLLDRMLDPAAAPGYNVPSIDIMTEEALTLISAGYDSTAIAMMLGVFYICSNPAVSQTLETELNLEFGQGKPVRSKELRKLQYLNAVVRETLRCSHPFPGRLPRVVPSEGYELLGHQLKPGTIIHTSAFLLNRDKAIWGPDADEFKPSRWLIDDSASLEKHIATFNKGSRQCLGVHLAWSELSLVLATLFNVFKVSIHETTEQDMEWNDHLFIM
ncbi:MAG: hypothetical protein Q9207_006719 [Kuettlingeria erythrocarpa]